MFNKNKFKDLLVKAPSSGISPQPDTSITHEYSREVINF